MSAKAAIVERITDAGKALAAHELEIKGYSENCLCTRLNDLEREGKLYSQYRTGKRFKEWDLVERKEMRQ